MGFRFAKMLMTIQHPEFTTALHLEHFEVLPGNGSTDLQGSSVLRVALSTKDICKELNLPRAVDRR